MRRGGGGVLYRPPTGPNPLDPRDRLSRSALRHGSLNSLFQVALYLPRELVCAPATYGVFLVCPCVTRPSGAKRAFESRTRSEFPETVRCDGARDVGSTV